MYVYSSMETDVDPTMKSLLKEMSISRISANLIIWKDQKIREISDGVWGAQAITRWEIKRSFGEKPVSHKKIHIFTVTHSPMNQVHRKGLTVYDTKNWQEFE